MCLFQTSGSTDTITSSSSADGELDMPDKGDNSGMLYTHLLDDDDSGIVMRTNSQTSLDRSKYESSYQYRTDGDSTGPGTFSEQKFPPPRPIPRRSITPNVAPSVDDRLIGQHDIARDRPKPAPRKLSFGNSTPDARGDNRQSIANDSLIEFDAKPRHGDVFNLVDQFEQLDGSGDYVLLRQPKTMGSQAENWDGGNKRSSISRTPAMKLGQNQTPKRPSIRKERSPMSPDDSPQGGSSLLDFDPLASNSYSQQTSSSNQFTTENKNTKVDESDSLLKDWDINQLASVTNINTPNTSINRTSFMYGQHPTPPPRQPITGTMTQQFYTPQPNMMHRQTGSALGFNNPLSQIPGSAPQVPPRPRSRISPSNTGNGNSQIVNQSSDPFSDLLNLNQSTQQTSPQKATSWETFN